jgi:dienelactone hydrolase/pimeloyl-ACP methyl ester carboxylesterase
MSRPLLIIIALLTGLLCFTAPLLADDPQRPWGGDVLPGTQPLVLNEPLHQLMVREISQFAEAELARFQNERDADWLPQGNDPPVRTPAEARELLAQLIGVVDPAYNSSPLYTRVLQTVEERRIEAVRWDVAEGLTGEALAIRHPALPPLRPAIILLGDADQSPESLLGWGDSSQVETHIVWQLAGAHDVHCVRLINRSTQLSGHPDIRWTNLTHREFVYRAGFELGRHIIGYEVQRVLALARALKAEVAQRPVHLVGIGEGGLLALYAAALDADHIDAVTVRGYFGQHRRNWEEPIYRNIWRGELRFGNAELASLIAPRPLTIDPSPAPEVSSSPPPAAGQGDIAAPGQITTPALADVQQELNRVRRYLQRAGAPEAVTVAELKSTALPVPPSPAGIDVHELAETGQRQQLRELILHTQAVLHRCDKERDKLWSKGDRSSLAAWEESAKSYRELVHRELIGKLPPADPAGMRPRTRKVYDEPAFLGYEVLLDVYAGPRPTGNFCAGGVLLIPRDLKPGERRPVVVCQHGLEGTPADTITTDPADRAFAPYKGFSAQLAKLGFIVYAPQNPYKGYHDFRVIQRKSNPVGRSLFSYIIEQHRQTLRWLGSLPYVDARRIGFYGLSYGGKTAVRVPNLLVEPDDQGELRPMYALSICSADFNEWVRKNASTEDRYSYVFTPEYEIFEWNMGHLANYAELSTLMIPRPFMVERGHQDGVAPDEWVGWEFAKVQRLYDQLGIGDRTEIEWFNGPHTINGQGTFRFLQRHLDWPGK